MFGNFKEIALINVQSHPFSIFKFDGLRIHRIRGEGTSNSVGKSVLRKALYALMTPSGKSDSQRRALIRRNGGNKFCRIIALSTTGIYFELFLHLEKKHCYYLMRTDDYEVKKYLADDYSVLLSIAGFHFLKSEDYSLNMYVTKQALPFTHFRPRLNYLILDSASGLKDYDLIMRDILENIAYIEQEINIVKNTISSYELHIESIGKIDLEREIVHETVLTRFIGMYTPIEELTPPINELVDAEESLSEITYISTEPIKPIIESIEPIKAISSEITRIEEFEKEISYIGDIVTVKPVEELYSTIKTIGQVTHFTGELIELNKEINSLSDVVDTSPIQPIIRHTRMISSITTELSKLIDTASELDSIEDIEMTSNVSEVMSAINTIRDVISDLDNLILEKDKSNKSSCISIEPCKALISHMKRFPIKEMDKLIFEAEELSKELELQSNLKKEIEELKILLPRCESCGQILSECQEVV